MVTIVARVGHNILLAALALITLAFIMQII
jgi:hypothetical protein